MTKYPELMEKVAAVLFKPYHELTDEDVRRLRRNYAEEYKTPERRAFRGLSLAAGAVIGGGGAGSLMADVEKERGQLLERARENLDDRVRHLKFVEEAAARNRDAAQVLGLDDAWDQVEAARHEVTRAEWAAAAKAKGALRRVALAGTGGAALGLGSVYGAQRLLHRLAKRRIDREMQRRGLSRG
jgi:hypothetical protein